MKEAFPLSWPSGYKRTRPQDQLPNKQWKHPIAKYQEALVKELERMGASTMLLSTNVPVGMRGQLISGTTVRDPGVAIYFNLKGKDDFSWQQVLQIHNPYPTRDEVEDAYKPLAIRWHPERSDGRGDAETFKLLSEARTRALAWVDQREKQEHQHVIACDKWNEVRLNINAIRIALSDMRSLERTGVSGILERVFKGFEEIPEYASSTTTATGA